MRPLQPRAFPSIPRHLRQIYQPISGPGRPPSLTSRLRSRARPPAPFRSIHNRASHTGLKRLNPVQAAIDPVAILVGVAISSVSGWLLLEFLDPPTPPSPQHGAKSAQEATRGFLGAIHGDGSAPIPYTSGDMTTEILPGHPGNVSPAQEAKLKELWQACFEILGVIEPAVATASPNLTVPSPDPGGKRKTRLSWFGRNKGGEEGGSGDSPAAAAGDNDKHGLNKEFKKAVASQSPGAFREAFWRMVKHDDPDAVMLRFLRARKWEVHDALVMLIAALNWRMTEIKVDEDIMEPGEGGFLDRCRTEKGDAKKTAEDFMQQLRIGKSLIHGRDKEGRPVCVVRARKHHPGEQTEKALELYTVYVIETSRLLLLPPVDTATIIFDMTSFSLSNMDYAPVKFMIKCFEANYPESLGAVLVYRAPWVFQGIWKIIRGWLDPVVASKIHFCDDEAQLSSFVDRRRIPKGMGGEQDWEYRYVEPVEGENARMRDERAKAAVLEERKGITEEYEKLTVGWIKGDGGGEQKKNIKAERESLAQRFRENYWRLDPYVRARSVWDRTGVINEDGRIDFYPEDQAGRQATANATAAPDVTGKGQAS